MSKPSTDELREQVRAPVLVAGDAGYDEARAVHNGMFDKHPKAVILAQQVADVIAGVNFAREAGLVGFTLPAPGEYGVGQVFLPLNPERRAAAAASI